MMYETFSQSERPDPAASAGRDTPPEADLLAVNARFNAELSRQIAGTLPPGHVYQLGRPGGILLLAGIPDLPIEMAASRLSDKSMQANHPFTLEEVKDLVKMIQNPLAVFRSATHIGSNVILTELKHGGKNFVVAMKTNKTKGRILINDVRSIHYRRSNLHIVNWINQGLADYIRPSFATEWLDTIKNELLSKPQYNSVEVRKQLVSATKIVQTEDNGKPNRRFEI